MKSIDLKPRQICDLEMILNNGFKPLRGFLNEEDYSSVCKKMRLKSGEVWPIPITLDVDESTAMELKKGEQIELRDLEGVVLGLLTVSSIWQPDKKIEAELVFGSTDQAHPAVDYLLNKARDYYIGGEVKKVQLPTHYDYKKYRKTPDELKEEFDRLGWKKIVAFQTRNPLHKAHQELTLRAAKDNEANLLIHPVVGMTKPGDIDHHTRVRCYEAIIDSYPQETTKLSLLPIAMRMAGPREALWHAIIRKNYGCTHFIVGRDHAGPGKNSQGEDFYDPYGAQKLVAKYESEIGIKMVPFKMMQYSEDRAQYVPADEVQDGENLLNISGTELRRRLREGLEIPEWFSPSEVITELRRSFPPMNQRGFTIFFTGLSGAGKSTLANGLMVKLMEIGTRPVTLLDGDIVRKHLSSELGFSKEHRDINVRRIGYVASEITKNRGVAICAPIAPYADLRREVRQMISEYGVFVEVYVSTDLDVCEKRDRKGLYRLAREGKIKHFTGIDDPYQEPQNPEIIIDTADLDAEEAINMIMLKLEKLGLV
ncbi:MAG: bifunctional sulfate adenylyltransferase/adenylylsulfate kinase [Rickettsiales bacterium]